MPHHPLPPWRRADARGRRLRYHEILPGKDPLIELSEGRAIPEMGMQLGREEARGQLRTAPIRSVRVENKRLRDGYFWLRYQICYQDKWLDLCRTDLMDDISTYKIGCAVGDYLETCHGARITETAFKVVDAFSDG